MNQINENNETEYAGAEDSLDLEDARKETIGMEGSQNQPDAAADPMRTAVQNTVSETDAGQNQPEKRYDGGQPENVRSDGGQYGNVQGYGAQPGNGADQYGTSQSYGGQTGTSAGQGYGSQYGGQAQYGGNGSQSYQNPYGYGANAQNRSGQYGADQGYGGQTANNAGQYGTVQSYGGQAENGAGQYGTSQGYSAQSGNGAGQYGTSQSYGGQTGTSAGQGYGSQYGGQGQYSGNSGQNYQNPYSGQTYQNQYGGAENSRNQYGTGDSGNYQGQTQNPNSSFQMTNQEPKKKKKKAPGRVKKAAGLVAAALVFGVIAGGTMVGVNILADSMKEEDAPPITVNQPTEKYSLSDDDISRIAGSLNLNSDGSRNVVMDVSDIVEDVMPSVVAINNMTRYENINPWFGGSQTYEVPSAGSGIIVGQNETDLLIVTNNHVVEDATETSVVFIDDTEVEATIKGTDSESDLAVVAVPLNTIPAETLEKISIAELGDSDELKVGQGVIAIGNALGYGQAVTVGYISALNREVTVDGSTSRNLLQTDAAINPGNSGGALLNMQGQVIGINEAKYTDTDVEGMGYAIPISQAQGVIDTLMVRRSGEQVEEDQAGYLGIQGITVDSTMEQQFGIPAGVYIVRIVEGGAASKTDLREKDVLVKFDGQTIRTYSSLQDLLKYYKKGETVEIVVKSLENGEYVERTITITLGGRETVNNG